MYRSIQIIQSWYRHVQRGRQARQTLVQLRSATVTIQSHIRSFLVRVEVRKRVYYRQLYRSAYYRLMSYQTLKSHFQSLSIASHYNHQSTLTSCLTGWRHQCTERIQAIRAAKLHHQQTLAAQMIQQQGRCYLARRYYQGARLLAHRLPALYRGYRVRQTSSLRITQARHRILRATLAAQPHLLLSHRTTVALTILSTSHSLTHIIDACQHLVVVTQLSATCRHRLITQYHVVRVILDLIRSCNRSQPHQEILRHAVLVLENMSRDPRCGWGAVITSGELEGLIVTMLSHKDLLHVLNSLVVTVVNLMAYERVKTVLRGVKEVATRLRMVRMGVVRRRRLTSSSSSSSSLMNVKSKSELEMEASMKGRRLYTVGLFGLSSLDEIDVVEALDNLIGCL